MEIKEFKFSGLIEFGYCNDFPTIFLKSEKKVDLVKKLRAIFDLYESPVSISYYICDSEKSEIEIQEEHLRRLFGDVDVELEVDSYRYSSYTYGTDYNTHLKVGGHDLFEELSDSYFKWCLLKISVKIE